MKMRDLIILYKYVEFCVCPNSSHNTCAFREELQK